MSWSKKKLIAKLEQYLDGKHIPYEYNAEEDQISLELCFQNKEYMLYPYITLEDFVLSININISEHHQKNFPYEMLNAFNMQSKFFKAFYSAEDIVCLEYRMLVSEIEGTVLDEILNSLYALEDEIACL